MRIALVILGLLASAVLNGCAMPRPAWQYYDQCVAETSNFSQLLACGKRRRFAACTNSFQGCSAEGNSVVMYADSLLLSIGNHEITEAEAERRWIEFKSQRADALRQVRATAAASEPPICNMFGCW
jgi:hypothetical protein